MGSWLSTSWFRRSNNGVPVSCPSPPTTAAPVDDPGLQAALSRLTAPPPVGEGPVVPWGKMQQAVPPAVAVRSYRSVGAALFGTITTKPDWAKKYQKEAVVSKWRREFVKASQSSQLTEAACDRIFGATLASLIYTVEGARNRFSLNDDDPPECAQRPLPVSVDITHPLLSIACRCGCGMCTEGNFYCIRDSDDDVDHDDTESDEEPRVTWNEIGLQRPEPKGTEEQKAQCSCYPNYKERLKQGRAVYLRRMTVCDANRISAALRDEIMSMFERLEGTANPDWHPGSNGMMQDLVHPSLGCFVRGVHAPPDATKSTFQWLPADVKLDGKGLVNEVLGRGFHGCPDAETQSILVKVLDRALPLLEEVVRRAAPTDSPHVVPLRNRTVQVIAKAASAKLTAAQPTFPEGSWHLEGIAAEQIIATAIYYPPSPNVGPASLAFRVGTSLNFRVPQDGKDYAKVHFGSLSGDTDYNQVLVIPCELGAVPTTPGTLLVFPNNLQHKVSSYSLVPGATEGRRRVLLFWLVAPGTRIPSTVDVPDPSLGGTISDEEQRSYRELLMLERKYNVTAQQSYVFERVVNLCEH